MIRTLRPDDDLTALVASWAAEWRGDRFGLTIDPEKVVEDLRATAAGQESTVLAKVVEGQVVGIMGLVAFKNPLAPDWMNEKIANEHRWYVMPAYRGFVRDFLTAARRWGWEHGCTHLMLNASFMASGMCERVSKLYEKMGLAPFEHVHIGRI